MHQRDSSDKGGSPEGPFLVEPRCKQLVVYEVDKKNVRLGKMESWTCNRREGKVAYVRAGKNVSQRRKDDRGPLGGEASFLS